MKPHIQGELGVIEVHNNVINSIVEHEAVRVDGVVGFAEGHVEGLAKRLGGGTVGKRGAKVRVDESGRLFIDLHLLVRYGAQIPEVARKVQESVMEALRTMTQASVAEINVHIDGIDLPADSDENGRQTDGS